MPHSLKHLLSPIQIGRKTIRNRVLVTAHVPGLEENGLVSEPYIAYQQARARGGAGLQISGSTAVHETGAVGTHRALDNTKPEIVDTYKKLAEAIHAEGGHFLVQLGHAAATVNVQDAGKPMIAPSAVQSQLAKATPEVMSKSKIDEVIEAHHVAAKRVRDGELDGVEILAAFGFLVGAFLSPFTNKREDDYGGSLENRMRFAFEVIDAIRDAIGGDKILGMRLPGDERVDGGLNQDDMGEIAKRLCQHGKLDYLNVIVGTNYSRIERMEHWPPTPAPHGLWVPLAAAIKKKVDIPVFTTGRITDPRMADEVIARGEADMVGMTRAHIADPDLVAKASEGRLDDIRPCVGANLCIAMATEDKSIRCLHNPEAGRESAWGDQQNAKSSKRVTVIGGGPAGMEAARVAAMRGHQVILHEASDKLGGQLGLWSTAPLTREFGKSIKWFEKQLTKLQVQVRLGSRLKPEDIEQLDTDAIVLATGSEPVIADPLPGQDQSTVSVVTNADIITQPPSGKNVVLVDEGGDRGALSAADAILDNNQVTVVSTEFSVGEMINPNIKTPLYKRFLAGGVTFRACEEVIGLKKDRIVIRNLYSGETQEIGPFDIMVNWRGNQVIDDLLDAIQARKLPVEIIGDCRAPRHVHTAIAEGALAARRL